jgi:hypothetical protein
MTKRDVLRANTEEYGVVFSELRNGRAAEGNGLFCRPGRSQPDVVLFLGYSAMKDAALDVSAALSNSIRSRLVASGGRGGGGRHADTSLGHLTANPDGEVANRRTDEVEDQKAEANDCSGQNDPVNSHGASFVFQESGKFGHGQILV